MIARSLQLHAEAQAVPAARGALAGLEYELDPDVFFDVSLCVSELVAHAVCSARPEDEETFELEISLSDGVLAAAVRDPGGRRSAIQRFKRREAESSLGLYIISRLADRWGVDAGDRRTWLELDIASRAQARSSALAVEEA